jgi:hypothetical protein
VEELEGLYANISGSVVVTALIVKLERIEGVGSWDERGGRCVSNGLREESREGEGAPIASYEEAAQALVCAPFCLSALSRPTGTRGLNSHDSPATRKGPGAGRTPKFILSTG